MNQEHAGLGVALLNCVLKLLGYVKNDCEVPSSFADPSFVSEQLFSDDSISVISRAEIIHHQDKLAAKGIDSDLLGRFFDEGNRIDASQTSQTGDLVSGYPRVSNRFQQDIVQRGAFSFCSPLGGKPLFANGGLPIVTKGSVLSVIHEIESAEPLLVGVSLGWLGSISFIWFISRAILVTDTIAESDWTSAQNVIATYLSLCVKNYDRLEAYRASEKKIALAVGFISNMGHYFWNEISGLERLTRLSDLGHVEKIYYREHTWLDVNDIMGSDHSTKFQPVSAVQDLFSLALDNKHLVVRPTGTQIDKELADKIITAASTRVRKLAPDRSDYLTAFWKDQRFVVFVNLRSHNKAWVEQEEGILRLAEQVARSKQSIIVYLDGYRDCTAAAQRIASNHVEGVEFIEGTELSFPETIFWASRCDFFVAVIGSGLVPLTWICDKSGIVHSDIRHFGQMSWWSDVREGKGMLLAPDISLVKDVVDEFYANYSIAPSAICNLYRDFEMRSSAQICE